jgi:hypothetical protein
MVTPTDGVENTAPQRVQTTVSPPRVANTTTQQMSPQPNTSAHSTPNSHRRQKKPARRAVTPQTPHVMVRRSARQQHNLSQDMMPGTISQANHCFSISTNPEPRTQKHGAAIRRSSSCQKYKCSNLPRNRQITQTPGTHHKIEIQNKMDAIHSKRNQQTIQH